MQSTEGDRFRNLIRGMGRMYGQEPDEVTLDAYWIALSDWQFQDFESACRHLMKTAKFMPRPSEFNDLRKAGRLTAGEAWAQALDWVRTGAYRHPSKTDIAVAIDRVVHAIGGWKVIVNCPDERLSFLERRFSEHFEQFQDVTDTRKALPQIANERLLSHEAFKELLTQ